jgi:Carboxypeptidase regulatory-like domain
MRHHMNLVRIRISPSHAGRIACAALLLASLACVLQMPVFAQQPATISGVLADSSGAGVPSANLTLTNQDTTTAQAAAKSDSIGNFEFPSVPAPGIYLDFRSGWRLRAPR